jgi:uncharacterized protein
MRYLSTSVDEFSRDKFLLLSGPRQVGKTTLAQEWLNARQGLYLNWDAPEDREEILNRGYVERATGGAVVLDEIHKYARWKSYLKGLYDTAHERLRVVVTGSARLDLYQKGGDSLLGRHEALRLHPLSIGELKHGQAIKPPHDWIAVEAADAEEQEWNALANLSGFPEPFFRSEPEFYRRWAVRRRSLLATEDVRDLTQIRQLSLFEHLAILLPSKIGSPLSLNNLAQTLQVAPATVASWVDTLDRLYYSFRLTPWNKSIARAVRKEAKLYLWDWAQVQDDAARFENMVASHLLKSVHLWNDLGHGEYSLHYLRNRDGQEIDFLVAERNRPQVVIECKATDVSVSFSKPLLAQLPGIPAVQLVNAKGIDHRHRQMRVVSAWNYLALFS